MGWSSVCKVLQKQTHDFLTHRHGTLVLICGAILITVSAFQFGEVALEWSTEKYAAVFNSFSDNIAGKSYRTRLCLPVPIDVVYTWVNGSDPKLITELRRHKMIMEMQLNESRTIKPSETCDFAHCIKATGIILVPPIPAEISLAHLGLLYPAFKAASSILPVVNPAQTGANVTLVMFDLQEDVDVALNSTVYIGGQNVSMRQAYYTSDWTLPNAVVLHDSIMMTGFPHTIEKRDLYDKIPSKYQKSITKFELFSDRGVALIVLSSPEDTESLLKSKNITIDNKEPTLTTANLVWDLSDYSLTEDVSASRFQDNEELRYSLRSIERYAPWVRHVYIVTNGQIPSWLNLDSPRLTVVPHSELYPNTSHLPTFSSPSIESHLHRIPGLSDKFIYLNDDVMFGKDVWPDDFYTHSRGQKLYLTWPVPNCQEGCPSSWIRDGYCDKACNNSECEWDGGDCKDGASSLGGGGGGGYGGLADYHAPDSLYCNTGCANSWIADRYCDNACNVLPCGFDAADCGTKNYHRLQGTILTRDKTRYTVPPGVAIFYFNMSSVLGENGTIEEATYNESKVVRTVAMANKFRVLTLVLYSNSSAETLEILLKGKDHNSQALQMNFTVSVDARIIHRDDLDKPIDTDLMAKVNDTKKVVNGTNIQTQFVFEDIPEHDRVPRVIPADLDLVAMETEVNMSLYELPEDVKDKWSDLLQALHNGDLTHKGFRHKRGILWTHFVNKLKAEGKEPIRLNITHIDVPMPVIGGDPAQGEGHDGVNQTKGDKMQRIVHNAKAILEQQEIPEQFANKAGDSMKAFLHNVSSQLRNNKNDGRESDLHPNIVENAPNGDVLHLQPLNNLDPQKIGENRPKDDIDNPNMVNVRRKDELKDEPEVSEQKFLNRKLNSLNEGSILTLGEDPGFLPWEKQGIFQDIQKKQEAKIVQDSYQVAALHSRHLLDTFGDSLRHVNKLYNKAFGYVARKVPAHMPHMIDKNIMAELQAKFPEEWDVTSSHKVRSSDDMQFGFSYYYYVMGEPAILTVRDVFQEMDSDHSGVLSDREIRTMATRLYEPPLDLQTLTGLEAKIQNCSKYAPVDAWSMTYREEKYYEKEMPQVTLHLIENCQPVIQLFEKAYKSRTKHKYEVVGEEEVAFKMIKTNVSQVVGQLDDIRRNPKKFICLNDNIDHSSDQAKTVKAVLIDFYESMYPLTSGFELSREYRNRFLHLDELNEWRKYRDWLKIWTQMALVFLILFTLASFFSDKIDSLQKKYFGRRLRRTSADNGSSPPPPPSRLLHV